ncbi:MAG: cytochrome c oxidase subunit III [Saprospiraceae bacterium]|nr:cytochrome c oxidase subunit III [Saprospiraceae bacterium]
MQQERNFLIHPGYIVMFLVLAGITALFLGFSGAYLYNRVQQGVPPVKLPSLFYWNTLILVASSGTLIWAKNSYKNDHTSNYKIALGITLALTILFLVAQVFAWFQLQDQDIFINHNTMASYLYVISGLHFAHVIAGIPFLAYFLFIAVKKMKSPVSVLIYFSDKAKKRKLDLLNLYWHFLDALWIYLVLFFLINYLIQ